MYALSVRFFTREWWYGGLEDDAVVAAQDAFKVHLDHVRGQLPAEVIRLFEHYGLHDGRLMCLQQDSNGQQLVMEVDAWNNFNGDYRVYYTLRFADLKQFALDCRSPNKRCEHGIGDLGYYEVDVLPSGELQMSFLFWSGIELTVASGGISVKSERLSETA